MGSNYRKQVNNAYEVLTDENNRKVRIADCFLLLNLLNSPYSCMISMEPGHHPPSSHSLRRQAHPSDMRTARSPVMAHGIPSRLIHSSPEDRGDVTMFSRTHSSCSTHSSGTSMIHTTISMIHSSLIIITHSCHPHSAARSDHTIRLGSRCFHHLARGFSVAQLCSPISLVVDGASARSVHRRNR